VPVAGLDDQAVDMGERVRMVDSLLDIMKKDLVELNEVEQRKFERMLDAVLEARGRGVPHEWLVDRLKKGSKDYLQLTDDECEKYKWIFIIAPGAFLAATHMGLRCPPQTAPSKHRGSWGVPRRLVRCSRDVALLCVAGKDGRCHIENFDDNRILV
jgi:hypothetical protein